ncbi:MAG: hypothetical protein ACI35O_04490 [Bacillaceae bacterium]
MENLHFWDITSPLSLIAFVLIFIWSLYGWQQKSVFTLLASSFISFGFTYLFYWSAGLFLLIIPILQLIAAIYLLVTLRKRRP